MSVADTPAAQAGQIRLGDLEVNRLGFGAMRLTGPGVWGDPTDRDNALAVLRRATQLGINFIDTADSYGPGVDEELIAEALHPYPDGLVIATKGGSTRPGPSQWVADCSPTHLREACEGSLQRLRLDRIDLYQLHTVDPRVPYEESIGALAELQREGKIRHIGISNVDLGQLASARKITEIVSVQNRYSVTTRGSESVLNECERESLAFIPWFPLDAGELAKPGGPLDELAREHNASAAQLVLAWLLWKSRAMLPIPGTSSLEHLEENVSAAAMDVATKVEEALV